MKMISANKRVTSERSRYLKFGAVACGVLGLLMLGIAYSGIISEQTRTCAYDHASGQPNPLGNRAFITVTERDGNTQFRYEQFPSPVVATRPATIEFRRTLILYDTDIEAARALVRENLSLYAELLGHEDRAGFSSYDEAMTCE